MIPAVNGICLAQGCGLALSVDIQIASTEAKFGWLQVKRGMSSVSGPTILARKVPLDQTFLYMFTGDFVDAKTALKLGLVNEVVASAELMPTAEAYAQQILKNAPLSIRAMKEATLLTLGMKPDEAFTVATHILDKVLHTEDGKEGLRAFEEKRASVWRGC